MEPFVEILKNPFGTIGFFFLILSLISVWINRRLWIWLPLFAVSFITAYFGKIVELKALVPIVILFVCHLSLTREIGSFWRLFAVMIAAVISFGFLSHFIVGFHNIKLITNWESAPDAVPMTFYLNYDKPLIALFVLGLYLPLIEDRTTFFRMLLITLPWAALTICVVLGLGLYMDVIKFDLKLPMITVAWLVIQFFFVAIPEEVFFRGFLQREIVRDLNNRAAGILAIIVVSLLVAIVHLLSIPNTFYFLAAFLTSALYGGIYLITGCIESSIIVHFLFNAVHFFFFTYPILKSAL